MRSLYIAVVCASAAFACTRPASAAPITLELRADHVRYFSNRYIVQGEGNVSVRLSDGVLVRGELFTMDLKLNRYLVAGNVRVDGPGIGEHGAGWAGFLNLDRSYLDRASDVPDRWTYAGSDYTHPLKGREQPGDAYYLPDVSGDKAWIMARAARIYPGTAIQLRNASVYTFGVYTPVVNYVVNFSPNPNFAQNALAGATADVGVPFNGGDHAISALHARYDSLRGAYLAFDQHYVQGRDYAVLSANPFTQHYRQFNGIVYDRLSPAVQTKLFYQLNTEQSGLSTPYEAASFTNLNLGVGLRRSSAFVTLNQYNYGLVHPFVDAPLYNAVRHPSNVTLAWNGFENRLWQTPLYFQLRSGIGFAHDTYGVGTFAGTSFNTLWQRLMGVTVYTRAIKTGRFSTLTLSGDKQRINYSLPDYVDSTTSTATYALTYPKFASLLTYQVRNLGLYGGRYQLDLYPPVADVQTSAYGTFSGFNAFRGLATYRSYYLTESFTPSQNLALNVQLRRSYDYPAPVAGLGGQPPWQITYDLRVRLSHQILMDAQRNYYFNFADQRWQPQFQLQFSP